jgi:hypothetical protein
MDSTHTLIFGFGVSLQDGLLGVVMFLAFGWLISWRNARIDQGTVTFLLQFVYGTLAMRYALSYIVFHHTLREGLWPAAWSTAAIVAIALQISNTKRLKRNDQRRNVAGAK